MHNFVYRGLPAHVIFGQGTLKQLENAIETVGGTRAMLLSTPGQAEAARDATSGVAAIVGHFDGAAMHTPVEVTQRALDAVREAGADCLVAFGGGSTTGLGKAIALRTDLPQVAIPTTYAGSEMTPILGQTENGIKTTLKSDKVLPELVLYDVDLTLGLPVGLSGTSGINAIAHAVEGLYAQDTNPIMQMMAKAGIEALADALPTIAQAPHDVEARAGALYGAWLCGAVLGSVGMALHHKLCHTLGGSFDLPHAETHAIVLPHAVAYNAPATPEAMAMLCEALKTNDPAQALYDLARAVAAPPALKDLGMPHDGIDKATQIAIANPYWNPRPIEREAIRGLIARAWAGERPWGVRGC
ncbi:maleylacetate reductase [Novosphingobium sp. Rr 2-17]|uniref:maleylacetate reductase n=1 Tax=Novosphingobium sp. Rr 2-17 TaxID=555793 RepID=UPI0002697ED6|nr:maleylacetate reductase [Novosphingobium sp. Rr 2-17]EIZ78347.1 maleylacetate reductase [Novosphingobium sp. Rr 2-17]